MAIAFIELRQRNKKYKLHANDISKVYKITKRAPPTIPAFDKIAKIMPETDDDIEAVSVIECWDRLSNFDFNIFYCSSTFHPSAFVFIHGLLQKVNILLRAWPTRYWRSIKSSNAASIGKPQHFGLGDEER
jgi:hypothetical protein